MPLKFLQSIKARHEKLKNKSKSTTDLLKVRAQAQVSAENAQMIPMAGGFKKKSQSKPYLRYNRKDSAQGTLQKSKEFKDKSSVDVSDTKKGESQTTSSRLQTDNSHSTEADNLDLNGNTLGVPRLRTSRSASCFSVAEEANMGRRLSDIALLDQYIGYHQRRAADEGTNTNRLVCAQLLRESFLRLEQMHLNDMVRSQSKHDLSRSSSALNQIPTNVSKPPQYQKNNHRRISSAVGLSQHYEPRLSLSNGDTRKSCASIDSADKDDDGPIQFSCNVVDSDAAFTINDTDVKTRRISAIDNLHYRDFFKKPKAMSKRRSVPNFSQQEIDIY
ncbi:hypothetical protein BsWGS_11229 [Bradybaena similaris]